MNIHDFIRGINALRPGVPFSYSGDGTDIEGLLWPEGYDVPPTYAEIEAKVSELETARADRELAIQELKDDYQLAMTRLDDIVTNGPSYTQTQARDAIVDLARIQRRILKSMSGMVTPSNAL